MLDAQKEIGTQPKDMLTNYESLGNDAKQMIEKEINLKKPMDIQMMQNSIGDGDFIMEW